MCGRDKVGWRGLDVELTMIVYDYGSPGPVAEKCQESKIDTWWTAKERVARQRARGITMACFWYASSLSVPALPRETASVAFLETT